MYIQAYIITQEMLARRFTRDNVIYYQYTKNKKIIKKKCTHTHTQKKILFKYNVVHPSAEANFELIFLFIYVIIRTVVNKV